MTDELRYPTLPEVLAIHEDIVDGDVGADPGVRSAGAIDHALTYVSEGYFGCVPDTIHEKAAYLVRFMVADHPFVDGNKRTALNTLVVFYDINGYEFDYGDESIRRLLRQLAIDADAVDMEYVVGYCRQHARTAEE